MIAGFYSLFRDRCFSTSNIGPNTPSWRVSIRCFATGASQLVQSFGEGMDEAFLFAVSRQVLLNGALLVAILGLRPRRFLFAVSRQVLLNTTA